MNPIDFATWIDEYEKAVLACNERDFIGTDKAKELIALARDGLTHRKLIEQFGKLEKSVVWELAEWAEQTARPALESVAATHLTPENFKELPEITQTDTMLCREALGKYPRSES